MSEQLIGQLSMFELLDQYETPTIPIEEQKKGVKGWIIQLSGIFLKENGFKEDWRGVETRPVIFKADTHKDKNGRLWQDCNTTKGPSSGWVGTPRMVFRTRPTWNDCLRFARENGSKDDPKDVRYYGRRGDWSRIYSYEEGA